VTRLAGFGRLPPRPLPAPSSDYRRHRACVEWLSAHRRALFGATFERWITPWDAELDLVRMAGLN